MRLSPKSRVRIALLALAGLGLFALPRLDAQTPTLATPLNNATSLLGAAHASGSDSLVLAPNTGSRFGTPSVEHPIRVTVASRGTLVNGQITAASTQTIYLVTARTVDTLSGLTAVESTTDRAYAKNDPVASLITAGTISDLIDAIGTGSTDAVKLTGDQTVAGEKTFSDPLTAAKVDVVGAAAGSGADRLAVQTDAAVNLVRVDANGTLFQNLRTGGNPTTQVRQLVPPDALTLVNWHECLQSATNPGTPPDAITDTVHSIGFNNNGNGAQVVSGWPSFTDAWEYHWWNGTQMQAERHIGAFHRDDLDIHIRPISFQVGWVDGNCSMSMCTHNYVITSDDTDPDDQTPIYQLLWQSADAETSMRLRNKEAAADMFLVASTAQTDAATLGRGTNDTSILTLNGQTATLTKDGGLEVWRESVLPAAAGHYWYCNEVNTAILEGGTLKGWLTLISPTGQGNGATVRFLSNGANVAGQIQLDNSGNLISRGAATGGVFFDFGANGLNLRGGVGSNLRLKIDDAGLFTFWDGGNFALGATTGTKIGTAATQKLGFFGKTPVVQPTMGAATAGDTWTAAEKAMLQTLWDNARALGLGN